MKTELLNIKEVIINRATVLTAVFFTIPFISSIVRAFNTGWLDIYYLHAGLYLIMIMAAVYRKQIPLNVKIIINSVLFIVLAFAGLYYFSIGGAYLYAVLAVAILTLLEKRRTIIIMSSVIILGFLFIAYSYITGHIVSKVDLSTLSSMPFHWQGIISSIILLIVIFIYGFGDLYNNLILSILDKNASAKKYMILFEKANDAIILWKDGSFFDCNEKTCEFFMCSKNDLIGKHVLDVSPEFQYNGLLSEVRARELLELCMKGEAQRFEWQHKKANGELFDCAISLNKVELDDDIYVQAILMDITEQKRKDSELKKHKEQLEELVKEKTNELELTNEELKAINGKVFEKNKELQKTLIYLHDTQAQLLQAEKMASIGVLTAGIAHEINNPLNYIMGGYIGLENYFKEHGSLNNKEIDVFLESIIVGVKRASGIVNGLNQFSRNNEAMDENCDIHSIIDNCLLMLNIKIKHNITVEKKYTKEPLFVKGNVGMLHQVFINVISNAIDAIENQGSISMMTSIRNENVNIAIKDNGCGIEKEELTKIMDPFYTSKPPGEGTGLGLSIAYTIIKEHKGTISFDSEISKGTTVTIVLPN